MTAQPAAQPPVQPTVQPTLSDLKRRRLRRARWQNALAYLVLAVIALITLYPFYWTFITSLESTGNIYDAKLLPGNLSVRNYAAVFTGTTIPFWRMVVNSLVICTVGVVGSVTLASLAAYPLARMRFPGRDAVFIAILVLMVLPNEAGLIVNYVTTIKLGLLQVHTGALGAVLNVVSGYAAIVLPSLASIVGLFLIRQAYMGIPAELIEAARIDGAKELTIWRRIMLPLTLPTIVAFAILEFVAFWNSFLWARILPLDEAMLPLSAGLLNLSGQFSTNSRAVMAGAVLTVLPILVVFLFGQRYFMRGLEGAVKG